MRKIINKYVAITIAFFLFVCINIPYETSVPYNETEFFTVEEPYTDFNYYNYTETEPYIEQVPLDKVVIDAQYENHATPPAYLWVNIKNTDIQSGNFAVDFHVTTMDGAIPFFSTISSPGYYISSGETKTVKVSMNQTVKEFSYDIKPPTKEVIKYRNITKQRTETKYRTVQRSREVVKLKRINASLIQRILLLFRYSFF